MKIFNIISGILAFSGLATASPVLAADTTEAISNASGPICGPMTYSTELDGDGSPRQRYLHKQLSSIVICDQKNTCAVSEMESLSYTIGWSVSTGDLVSEWISGGFEVSVSWETGTQHDCHGSPGDAICVWQRVAHTAYKVIASSHQQCTGSTQSDNAEITSPNINNRGGYFYCVTGTCRTQGDEYWEN